MREIFTDEEWAALLQAPSQAIIGVVLADRVDPVSFLQELKAGVEIVAEELQRKENEVLRKMSAILGVAY